MSFSVDQLPLSAVRQAAAEDTREAISQLLQHPDANDLHGFAICTDPDVTSVYATAETNARLKQRAELLFKKNHETDPNSELTLEFATLISRFEPADWNLTPEEIPEFRLTALNGAVDAVWKIVDDLPDSDEKILEYCPAASRACLRAIGEGVREFRESNSTDLNLPPLLALLVWEHDPDFPDVVREIAEQLNHPETFELFSQVNGY